MAIFKLTGAGLALTIRARCITCARTRAALEAGIEGPRVWRDSALSTVELLQGATGYAPDGRTEILKKESTK